MSPVNESLAGVPAECGTRLQFYGLVDCLLRGMFCDYFAVLRLATLVFLLGEGFELRDERSSVRRRQDRIESLNPKGKEQKDMEELASVINNFARLILYAGGGVFTIAVCVAGFFYMTAFGDPQKQNIARGALVGSFVGVCIMGVAFLAPKIMSQFVLEPAGLEGVDQSAGNTSCDRTLRSALIVRRGVGNAKQVNQIIRAVQAQRAADCNQEVWNPFAHIAGTPPGGTAITTDGFGPPCADAQDPVVPLTIGNTDTPTTLANLAKSRFGNATYGGFARDATGNILVEFETASRPTDGSQCWLYVAQSNYWDQKA